jgi:hypothetical protein
MKKIKVFSAEKIKNCWSTGKKITLNNIHYRVGRMSYGDYFLEPGKPQGETKPFNKGTLWLEKVNEYSYKIV